MRRYGRERSHMELQTQPTLFSQSTYLMGYASIGTVFEGRRRRRECQ